MGILNLKIAPLPGGALHPFVYQVDGYWISSLRLVGNGPGYHAYPGGRPLLLIIALILPTGGKVWLRCLEGSP